MKNAIIAFIVVFLLTTAGIMGYMLLEKDKDADVLSFESNSTTQTQQQNQQQSTQQSNNPLLQQQSQPQLPGPQEFGVYEEYATSESPLFIDIRVGDGQEVSAGDTVAMLYSGFLTNGQLFDQTAPDENNQIQPFIFTLGEGRVISGWEQTIAGMRVGGQRRLIIPSQFGYGPTGQGSIPPDAMLIFDVEMVDAESPTQQ